jgi:predicted dienelactone hydrolase
MTRLRKIIWFMTFVVSMVLLKGVQSVYASPQDQGQNQGQQQPGTFPVGHATRVLNVTGTRGETRNVNVHLWYPAPDPQNCQSGDGNSQGCPPSVYTSRLNGIPLLPQWDPLSWTIAGRQAFEELPISSAQSSYPVIIFSHGNQNNAIDYVYTLESLASAGFIVAAPDHVNNTQDDVRIDFINAQARTVMGASFPNLIPCFDGLSTLIVNGLVAPIPCEVSNRVKAEHSGKDPFVSCPSTSLTTSTPASVIESMTDRLRDVSAVMNALPNWFGTRADTLRVGVMGHSRGTVTALAAAGGSACWNNLAPLPGVKAIMGLAIGGPNVTLAVDLAKVSVPALLVAGELDTITSPDMLSKAALSKLGTSDNNKQFVLIQNANHRHFDSGLCAQTQSSGAIAESNPGAILDLQTVTNVLTFPNSGVAMDFCGYDTFTMPSDITSLVFSLTGFSVTPTNVPRTGLDSNTVKDQVVQRAVAFFGRVL